MPDIGFQGGSKCTKNVQLGFCMGNISAKSILIGSILDKSNVLPKGSDWQKNGQ